MSEDGLASAMRPLAVTPNGHTPPVADRLRLSDVARAAGVSPMTVSRVVNGAAGVSKSTRAAVERVIDELGYIPNRVARSLVLSRLGAISLVIPDVANPFFTEVVHAVEEAARECGYTVLLANTDGDLDREKSQLHLASSLQIDGMIIAPAADATAETLEPLLRRGLACVLMDRDLPALRCDKVRGESVESARALTQHLIDHGHERIAMISGPAQVSTARDRVAGYRRALRDAGIKPPRGYYRYVDYTRMAGYREAMSLLTGGSPPTAIVAANNFLSFGILDAGRQLRLRVPDDLAIVAYDDCEATPFEPLITCAIQPARAIGAAAAKLLFERLSGQASPPRTVLLDTEIHIRHSCGHHRA